MDLVVLSHFHGDHFDQVAKRDLDRSLPIVTTPGRSFAARVGASLLTAIGLTELITPDLAAYEALALSLAHDATALRRLRERLAANRLTTPLFDTDRFVRHLEEAYRRIAAAPADRAARRAIEIEA